jgi:hypothetical protein
MSAIPISAPQKQRARPSAVCVGGLQRANGFLADQQRIEQSDCCAVEPQPVCGIQVHHEQRQLGGCQAAVHLPAEWRRMSDAARTTGYSNCLLLTRLQTSFIRIMSRWCIDI